MRLLVLTCAALLIAAPTAAATTYTGNGGRAPGFKLELDRHGRSLTADVTFQAPCDVAGVQENREMGLGDPNGDGRLRLDRHGRFHETRRGLDTGLSYADIDFTGRVGKRRAYGTFDITLKSKQIATTCTTGLVHWTAHAS